MRDDTGQVCWAAWEGPARKGGSFLSQKGAIRALKHGLDVAKDVVIFFN